MVPGAAALTMYSTRLWPKVRRLLHFLQFTNGFPSSSLCSNKNQDDDHTGLYCTDCSGQAVANEKCGNRKGGHMPHMHKPSELESLCLPQSAITSHGETEWPLRVFQLVIWFACAS